MDGQPQAAPTQVRSLAWSPGHTAVSRRAARTSLSLWLRALKPLHLAGAPEGRRQFQRSTSWRKSPSSFSAPKRALRSPQGPVEGSLEGGWTRQRNFTTSCHPGHVPAVRDLVSTRLLGHPCGACVQISGQAMGSARPLAPQEVEGKESLWKDPPNPRLWQLSTRTKKLFWILTPDRREGAWEAQGGAGLRRR